MDEHQKLIDACCRLLRALDCDAGLRGAAIYMPDAINAIAEVAERSSPSEPVLVAMFGAVQKAGAA